MSAVSFPAIVPSVFRNSAGSSFTSGVSTAFSAWVAAFNSIGFTVSHLTYVGTALNGAGAIAVVNIDVGVGGAGSEIVQGSWRGQIPTTTIAESVPFLIDLLFIIPLSSRISVRASSDQATGATIHGFVNIQGY